MSGYIFYVYYELKEERENSIYINRLSGVTQQLRQTVYNAFSESGQLRQLEKEAQHFRYLLLQTESQLIGKQWKNTQRILLHADLFIDDVDNLLVSAYSMSNFTRQLMTWQSNTQSQILTDIVNDISRFLIFETQWSYGGKLNDEKKFNLFLSDIEKRLHQHTEKYGDNILIIHRGLERLIHQFQRIDKVINHPFIREIANYQNVWSLRMLNLVNQLNSAFLLLFLLLVIKWFFIQLNSREVKKIPQTKQSADKENEDITPVYTDMYDQSVTFDSNYLLEQLDYCYESFESILNMFVVEHQNDVTVLKHYLNHQDFSASHKVTHKLKGVTGNIGALTLESLCKQLDDELRNNLPPNAEHLNAFEKVFTMTLKQITMQLNDSKLKTMA